MDDEQTSDEVTFLPETLEPIVFDIIESVLKDKVYYLIILVYTFILIIIFILIRYMMIIKYKHG